MVAATAARGRRLGAGPRRVLRDLRPVEDGDPELLRCTSDECGGGGDQQQGAGDHQADVRAEVRRESVDASDPGLESGLGSDRLVDRADPPDGPRAEGPFRPVLHLKTEESCYFTSAEVLNHVHGKADRFGRPRGYVGDLKTNRKLEWKGQVIKASELAASIPAGDRKEMRIGERRQWYFTVTVRIPGVEHKVRIVILWHYRNDERCCKILVTNRITWEVSRIVRVYRHRWTGTETFHRDGKQQVGLGDCQRRDLQGPTRPRYLVMLAYSRLMSQLRQGRAKEWALHRLMIIGEACRAMVKETLRTTLAWAIEQVTERNQPYGHVVAQLGLT